MCSAGFEDVVVTAPCSDLPRPGTKPIRHAVVQARAVRDRAAATERWAEWLDHGSARLAETQAKAIAAERGTRRRPRRSPGSPRSWAWLSLHFADRNCPRPSHPHLRFLQRSA